jgi:hypothetical protein
VLLFGRMPSGKMVVCARPPGPGDVQRSRRAVNGTSAATDKPAKVRRVQAHTAGCSITQTVHEPGTQSQHPEAPTSLQLLNINIGCLRPALPNTPRIIQIKGKQMWRYIRLAAVQVKQPSVPAVATRRQKRARLLERAASVDSESSQEGADYFQPRPDGIFRAVPPSSSALEPQVWVVREETLLLRPRLYESSYTAQSSWWIQGDMDATATASHEACRCSVSA